MYAGLAPSWKKIDLDLGYVRYEYPRAKTSINNTNEVYFGLSSTIRRLFTPGYKVYYSDDFFGGGSAWYHDLSLKMLLPHGFTLAGHRGWNRFDQANLKNYQDYSVGISREYRGFGFDLSWVGRSDEEDCSLPFQYGGTGVFTLSKSFFVTLPPTGNPL